MAGQAMVSVYIPTRDRLQLLKRAVDSVLTQDHRNLELIVVDDGSSDGTAEYLRSKAQEDARLKFRLNPRNIGACSSRNIAIAMAGGEFITGLDDDDYFLPSHLSTFLDRWPGRRKGVVALFSHALALGRDGTATLRRRGKVFRGVESRKTLLAANRVGSQLFLRTADLRAIDGFDPGLPAWQDLECWYRLLKPGGSAQCSGACTYVVDEGHDLERITTSAPQRIQSAYERFLAKHPLSWTQRQLLHANYRACILRFHLDPPLVALAWRGYHLAIRVLF